MLIERLSDLADDFDKSHYVANEYGYNSYRTEKWNWNSKKL